MEDIILKFSKYDLMVFKERAKKVDKTIEDYLQTICLKSLTIIGSGINIEELKRKTMEALESETEESITEWLKLKGIL